MSAERFEDRLFDARAIDPLARLSNFSLIPVEEVHRYNEVLGDIRTELRRLHLEQTFGAVGYALPGLCVRDAKSGIDQVLATSPSARTIGI